MSREYQTHGKDTYLTSLRPHRKRSVGNKLLSCVLAVVLIQPWALLGNAYAAYVDETALNMPPATDDSYSFDAADINGDGIADLLVANRGQSRLLVSNGLGGFADETASRLPLALHTTLGGAFIDLDGVNGPDLLLVGEGQNRVLMNDGTGVFTDETSTRIPAGERTSMAVAVGDLDGDTDPDAVVANRAGANRVLINNGGVLVDDTAARLAADADFTYGLALGDANGDGALDVFFANFSGQNRLHLNNFLGYFTDSTTTLLPAVVNGSGGAAFLDADADGDQDIAVANGPAGVSLLVNDAGVYTEAGAGVVPTLSGFAVKVHAADINFDGSPDLLVSAMGQDSVLLNDGAGTFTDATASDLPADDTRTFGAQFVDADADLDLDFVAATPRGQNRYYENAIAAPRVAIGISPDYIEVTDTVTIEVTVFDEDGVATQLVEVIRPDTAVEAPTDLGGGVYSYVPSVEGVHTVQVTAEDTLSNSVVRTATFLAHANDVTDPLVTVGVTPSTILLGESAAFSVSASDDRSVTSLTLTVGGVNVPLDASGQATYAPTVTGALPVVATAQDAAGNVGQDATTLLVDPDLVVPVVTLSATPDPVDITNPITVDASATDNIAVVSFEVLVTGPSGGPVDEPVPLDGSGQGTYVPYIPGTYTFEATATDPAGNVTVETATVEAQGIPDSEAPVVSLNVVPGTTIPGGTVTLTVDATDNIFVLSRALEVNGVPLTLDASHQATFSPPVLGSYTAVATATDPTGNIGSDTVVFAAVDPATDTDPPVVDIASPDQGSDITGIASFAGTATDLTLVSYELAYRRTASGDDWTTFFTGSQVVENDVLGELDTTVLENGLVDIRLTAADINGLTSEVVEVFTADGGFKPGIFTIRYNDLTVPVEGIPITVYREYDSRRRAQSDDFGNGWNLEVVQDGTYTNNRELGAGWRIENANDFFNTPCSVSNEQLYHITEIRFSDTEFYKFAFNVEFFGFASTITGTCIDGVASFTQVGGIPGATLDIIGSNVVTWSQGSSFLTYDLFDPRVGEVFNPEDVRLTTQDGRVFDLNLLTGLNRIGDTNGNSLFINDNGVVHTNGTQVQFNRDGAGRITSIVDPANQVINYVYDVDGNLQSHQDRVGNTTTYFYTSDSYLERIVDPTGGTPLRNEYDATGRLVAQIDAEGNRTEYTHDPSSGTETITEADGGVSILQYDEEGNLTAGTIDGEAVTFTYDANGNKLTETDANGNTTTFTYDSFNRMLSETDALGNAHSYVYNAAGQPTTVTDPSGNELNFAYDTSGNVLSQTDAGGNTVQSFSYDSAGNPTQMTTAAGTTAMTYDASGNITQETAPNGRVTTYTYDDMNRRLTETVNRTVGGSSSAETTTFTYDANGNLLSRTDPLGNLTTYLYDGNDRKIRETDALGRITTFAYDDRGLRTRTDYPDTTFEIRGYDLKGRLTAVTDTGGRTRFFEYDANDYLSRTIHPDGSTLVSVFDGAGNRLTQTDANGNTTTWTYDAIDRIATRTGPLGEVTTFTYTDRQFNPTTVTDPLGNVTSYSYDTGMLFVESLLSTTYADTAVASQTWAPGARIASRTDEHGHTTAYSYDAVGNLLTVTDANGGVATYTYDEVSNLLTQTDTLGRVTSFTYDAMGNRLTQTLPGGQTASWTYDAVGNVATYTDFNGATTNYEYDDRDRLTRRVFPGGTDQTFAYTGSGKLASMTDARGTTSFTYDVLDRVLSATQPDGTTLTYTYDLVGNRASVASPAGTVTYGHDAVGRITGVVDRDGGSTSYSYDLNGNVTGIAYANGTSAALDYDSRNRTVRVTHTAPGGAPVLADYQYDLDAAGQRAQVVEAAGRTLDFSYDALHRITQVIEDPSGAALTSDYTYDAAGNVLTINIPGSSITATYDINDRALTVDGRTFVYDDNGNLTSITSGTGVTSFDYDAQDQLVQRTEESGVVTDFEYDALGNRVARTVDGVRTEYLVDNEDPSGVSQVLEERDDTGGLLATYERGHGPVRMERGSAASYFHPDALGSTRVLTDAAGAPTDSYDYDAWGNLAGSSGTTPNELRFAGERQDPSTGLYHLRARYYDPEIARFITSDPHPAFLADPATLHRYAYALNDPVNRLDPTGEFSLVSVSISIAIVGVLASIAYTQVYKPAKDVYDKMNELLVEIPNGVLNKEASRDELGITEASLADAYDERDLARVVELGDGIVEKAYDVAFGMAGTGGQVVGIIHARNSAYWLKHLPQVDGIPGNYVNCGFNQYVQGTYALGWVTSLAAAKRFEAAANVIAVYLMYFNFLALVGATAGELGSGSPPGDTSCPPGGAS